MGVGEMAQMIESIALGVDMFDCVLPTRLARNGTSVTSDTSTIVDNETNIRHETARFQKNLGKIAMQLVIGQF